ncbi:MAG TPA: glutamine-hydrolyzing GMP synthase, partial [Actinobacteria bacterium]|nr:glutamine-hydrolyzing GMP synthase [Actinomycetota bacterium]
MDSVLVIDFGGQYSQLIARRIRELRVFSELIPYGAGIKEIKKKNPKGLILSGSPYSIASNGDKIPVIDKKFFSMGIPILGICYGMQLMAKLCEGKIIRTGSNEYGKTEINLKLDSPLFKGLKPKETCWMSHKDSVGQIPDGFRTIASTPNLPAAGIEHPGKKFFGIQFHPEVAHTPSGMDILRNFLFNICDCSPNWTMVSIIESETEKIIRMVGKGKVICGLSGGVDSSVAALLVHHAVGERLTCIFVDHGLLRKDEAKQVIETFKKNFRMNLIHINAQDRFSKRLRGIVDPEEKRKIIGEEFIRIFEEEALKIKDADCLVQGTLYSDVIESGAGDAAKIKSHHNVGGLPEDMKLKLIEPLRLLFKDEVRKLGSELGLSDEIVWRQPFPGPGLAIRIIGEVTLEKIRILQDADKIVIEEIKRAGL